MAAPYAQPSDVTDRWGRQPSPEEASLIAKRLEDVERKIRRRIPDLDDQIVNGDIAVEDLIQVEADAVLRLVRNPDGYLSESDGDYTYMLQQGTASGQLTITPEEWEMLGIVRSRMSILVPNPVMPV